MKYCITYKKSSKAAIEQAEELLIQYNEKKDFLECLLQYPQKRIIIAFDNINLNEEILKTIIKIKKENKDIQMALRVQKDIEQELIDEMRKNKIDFFLNYYAYNLDIFWGLIKMGVSDIYITEDLGFNLIAIKPLAEKENIVIRAFPNIAQSAWKNTEDYKKFFIRPDDVDFYSQYIDVLEIITTNENVILNIYKELKTWNGELKEIIIGIESPIDNRNIIPTFSTYRVGCEKKCNKNKCEICKHIFDLSQTLSSKDFILTKDKEKIPNNLQEKIDLLKK